jgi:alkylation response protein AidB-like acyl-CoA dehydrogenase
MSANSFTAADVAAHNRAGDLWVTIDGGVYDLSRFGMLHPGGLPPLLEVAGGDATELFFSLHRAEVLAEPRYAKLRVGTLRDAAAAAMPAVAALGVTPYAEGAGFWRKHSPYYNETHHRFRAAIRAFVDEHIAPTAAADDEAGTPVSLELNKKMGAAGILAVVARVPAVIHALGMADKLPGGVKAEEMDEFHDLILGEEMKRCGCYGLSDGLIGGLSIGLPPIFNFGSEYLRRLVLPGCISGAQRIALAISEPYAGSDVAQIRTKGVRTADGDHVVVSGVKKWITGGMYADFFTTLVNIEGEGMSLLCIERSDAVETRPIKTAYSAAAGTAYVVFDGAKVPARNIIGEAGQGFYLAMANFNKERWGMVGGGNRLSRLMVEECFKWATQRKIFGKRLIDQPVIRLKLAEMAAGVEAVHSMNEDITFQMTKMSHAEINKHLAGPIGLLKYKQTRVATMISDHACQIFGGRALTRSGMGQYVEKFQRSFKMQAILGKCSVMCARWCAPAPSHPTLFRAAGGSEEILADFAIRQALKRTAATPSRL